MIKLEFNGRPFDPKTFEEQILRAAMEQVANEMHERVSSIRHPGTGEFPTVVVNGTSLEDMSMRIDGSPELLQIVNERLGAAVVGESDDAAPSLGAQPKVFLSWGWEDRSLAEPIANALMAKGVDTWWSEWCINAGDSLRQKIDEGLNDCTHFVVLLTPQSIRKPWVNQEIEVAPFSRTPYRYGRRSPKCPKPSHRIRCNFDSKSSNWREQAERQRSYRVNSGHRPKALPTG
ncbi:MAG: toll/interleukin-1 receptor domain-containing protein [Rhodoferax sp.]